MDIKHWILNISLSFGMSCAILFAHSAHAEGAVPVDVMTVEFKPHAKAVIASGVVRPVSEQALAFKVAGIIDEVLVREGAMVKKGQVLAVLTLDEIDARVDKAQAMLADAKRQLQRINELERKQLASDELGKQAKTAVDVANSDLTIAKFNRQYAAITAPADGRILTRHIEPNELVNIGQQAFVFADASLGWNVRLNVADVDVVKLQLGDKATISLDAFPEQQFTGNVFEIAGRANSLSQTFEVDVVFEKLPRLYSGLIAHTHIIPSVTQHLSKIPLTAFLRAEQNNASVYVLDGNNQVQKRQVQFAYLQGANALVSQGLQSGDKVVVRGGSFVIEGQPIKVINDMSFAQMQSQTPVNIH